MASHRPLGLHVGDVFTIPIDVRLDMPCDLPPERRRVGVGQIVATLEHALWVVVFDVAYPETAVPEATAAVSGKRLLRRLTFDALLYHEHWTLIGNARVRWRHRPLRPSRMKLSCSPMVVERALKKRFGVVD